MHSINRYILVCVTLLFTGIASTQSLAKKNKTTKNKIVGIEYFKFMFGHIHLNPLRYSESLTAISCGHPVKIYNKQKGDWKFVKVGPYKGYIHKKALSAKKPLCFQDRYPKFFDLFELDPSEQYYWGRLFDQYVRGKSKLK
ncbi:MAG: SH3 domain-containing protein [Bacteriovoracaceae bacterium]|nr:SH3 domain-containing protein [Bacteriovoracaceae bacterium]